MFSGFRDSRALEGNHLPASGSFDPHSQEAVSAPNRLTLCGHSFGSCPARHHGGFADDSYGGFFNLDRLVVRLSGLRLPFPVLELILSHPFLTGLELTGVTCVGEVVGEYALEESAVSSNDRSTELALKFADLTFGQGIRFVVSLHRGQFRN